MCRGRGVRGGGYARRDRLHELVAASGHRRDGVGAEQLAQAAHLHLQVVLLDHESRPDRVEQLRLFHHPVASLHQRDQQVERARAERHRRAVDQHLPLGGPDFAAVERIVGRHGGGQG